MIIKSKNKSNFTILSNAVLLDDTISDKARGVLVRLLCRPSNWNLNVKHLVKTGKDGNAAIRSAIRELEAAGYIRKEVSRHANGRIIGIEYIICENPSLSDHDHEHVQAQDNVEEKADVTQPPIEDLAEVMEPVSCTQAIKKQKTALQETVITSPAITQSAPIINTDIKQKLMVTTTTCAREAEPVPEPVICDEVLSLPSSSSTTNEIINLIPEQHQTPVVLSLVNKAIVDYPEFEVKEAVAYAGANVRGGSMQFKAYLDKTLKNKWGEGYLEAMDNSNPFGQNLFGAGQFPNGFTTGSKRLDGNLSACLEFAALSQRKGATA